MNLIKLNTIVVSLTNRLAISLLIIFTLFISSPLWADENSRVDENVGFDDKLALADSIRSSQPKRFILLINEMNQQTNNLSNTQQYYLEYLNLYLLMYQGKLAEAITSAKALINSNANISLKFRAKLALVNTFAASQNWPEGLSTLSNLLAELPLIEDKKNYQQGLLIAAIFYNQIGQYELGLYYAQKVELSSEEGRDQCIAKAQIIEPSFKLKQLTPTSPIIKQAISLCRINNEHLIISFINSYVAKMYLENQQQDQALQLLNATLQDTLNTKYPHIIAEYYSMIAQAHWLNKKTDLTKQFALKALDNEKKEGTAVAKVLSYQLLFEVYQAENNYELALLYHQKYAIADKLYYDETQAKNLAFQVAEHQAMEKENRIKLLNEKNASLTSEKALLIAEQALNRANTENTRLIIFVLVLTLSVLTFWGIRLLYAHKRIKQLAEYDTLTGVYNRGHFIHVANRAIEYCQSAEQTLSLIMFDLDDFKKINDTYGHACGDWALKRTVEVCREVGRRNDIFSRLGGEEFCILLTSCNKKLAYKRAEVCRLAIASIDTADSGFDFNITASFGVTDTKASDFNLEKLLADADSATYQAKHSGRNQSIIFQISPPKANVVELDTSRDVVTD